MQPGLTPTQSLLFADASFVNFLAIPTFLYAVVPLIYLAFHQSPMVRWRLCGAFSVKACGGGGKMAPSVCWPCCTHLSIAGGSWLGAPVCGLTPAMVTC